MFVLLYTGDGLVASLLFLGADLAPLIFFPLENYFIIIIIFFFVGIVISNHSSSVYFGFGSFAFIFAEGFGG